MKILVFGSSGILGRCLVDKIVANGHDLLPVSHRDCDVTEPHQVNKTIRDLRPDWVINCAAWTDVDAAETNQEPASEVNADAPYYIGTACSAFSVKFLHLSTDFVFDGTKSGFYDETDDPNPINHYGFTKLQGEKLAKEANKGVVIARTGWLFGGNLEGFPQRVIGKAFSGLNELTAAADLFGCPTYAPFLASTLLEMVEKNVPGGIYHAVGPEKMSKFEFARRILQYVFKESISLKAVSADEFETVAKRPKNTALSTEKLLGLGIESMPKLGSLFGRTSKGG